MTENATTMTGAPAAAGTLENRLKAAWRREIRFHVARAAAVALPWLVGLGLAEFLLDWGFDLPGYVRVALLPLDLAVLGWIVWTRFWRRVRRYRAVILALRVEKAHPSLNNLLVSAIQLEEEGIRDGASPALVRAVKRMAAEHSAALDFGRIVDFARLRRVATAAAAALVVVAVCVALKPGYAWAMAVRLTHPWSALPYPTRTTIEAVTRDLTVRNSDPVQLEARAGGEIPIKGTLLVKFGSAGWESIDLARHDERDFRYVFEQVPGDFDYRFRLGDAVSPTYRVTVVRPPQVVSASVSLDYPAYTHMAAETTRTLNVKVPEDTRVTWQLQVDRPVTKAELLLENRDPLAMTVAPEGRSLTLAAPAEASSSYRFRLTWRLAGRECADDGPTHFMRVIPDLDPRVEMTYPVEDEKAALGKVLTLDFRAQDDYGLECARVVYAVNDGAEQRRPPESLGGQPSVEREMTLPLKEALPDLKEGDILTFSVEVADGRAGKAGGGSHTARSKSRRVQFVSAKEYLEYAMNRQRKYLGQIRPLYLQERDAGDRVRELESPETGPIASPAEASPPAAGKGAPHE